MSDTLILSIKKALDIIDILVFEDFESKGVSLTKLSKLLSQRTNTMHNILKTMSACGYVEKNEDGLYTAGRKCRYIGDLNSISPRSAAYGRIKGIMEECSAAIGESLVFAILSNSTRIPILSTSAKNIISIDIDSFEHENIFANATGRVLAAYADERVFGLPFDIWDGIDTETELSRRLSDIHQNGFHKTLAGDGQVVAMAVPVNIRPLGALGCYAPVFRCDNHRANKIIALLQDAAKAIEAKSDICKVQTR